MMNQRMLCLFILIVLSALGLVGCASGQQASNLEGVVLPVAVKSAQANVLEYVTSTSRLSSVPASADWQLDKNASSNGKYRFFNGNWMMIIFPAAKAGMQQVIIINMAQDAAWCGFIESDGDIVDTCLSR